jgi:hypothetical protein
LEIIYRFGDDDPGDIVEALNEEKDLYLYELNEDGSGIIVKININGLHIKQVEQNGRIIESLTS